MKLLSGFACLPLLLSSWVLFADNATYTFPNGRQAGQIDKVTCQLEGGGEYKHIEGQTNKEQVNKMSVDCKLVYDEMTLAVAADPQGNTRSARYYEKAEGFVKNGDESRKPALREERRLIGAEVGDRPPVLFSPKGTLNEDDLDVVVVLGNSLLLDRLLPEKPVAVGESWKHSERLLAHFLSLDTVGQCDVQSTLKEVTEGVARFEISGRVAGMVDSVSTEIELKARYRYDRKRNRIDWIGLLVKEQRKPSPVTDGFDIVARLQVTLIPQTSSPALNESVVKNTSFQATPELLQLEHRPKRGEWQLTYDRNWKINTDAQGRIDLHLFENGEHLARCTLSPLPPADPEKLVTLEAFQDELRTALEKSFGEFVKAGESAAASNYRLLRVEIRGTASELPMRWVYYHVADSQGRQAVFVVVIEEKLFDRLAEHDKKLIESFRFLDASK
ncbi:MAG: hypothetical protein IT426_01800 [Pirellulales bacterium]|nr:hypothetical protein [Pirellulales bacterium]